MWKDLIKKELLNRFKLEISRVKEGLPLIINEAVNTDKEVIYISVPKTGSTTIRKQIRQEGEPFLLNSHLNIIQVRELIYVYLLKTRLRNIKEFPSVNIPTDIELRNEATSIFDKAFKFSTVRNPWARAVSIYFRNEGYQTRELISFQEFCEKHIYASDTSLLPSLHKNQYDWFCNLNDENIMDYIFKIENYNESIDYIREATNGKLVLTSMELNRNKLSKSRNYQDMYNSYTRQLIARHFEKDIDMFKYTF